MRRTLVLALLALSSIVACASPSQPLREGLPIAHAGPDFPDRGKADSIVVALVEQFRLPGLSVAIARDDRLVYAAAVGWADPANRVPMTTTTRMRLASVSKPVTSLALMTLAAVELPAQRISREPEAPEVASLLRTHGGSGGAVAVLTQRYGPQPHEKMDAIADTLAVIAVSFPGNDLRASSTRSAAVTALLLAGTRTLVIGV